jgi:hypothetical protein
MEIVGEVLCLKIEGSLKDWLKYLLQGLDLIEARERERESLSSRSFGSKCFQVNGVAN